jgi:hypothetical protein
MKWVIPMSNEQTPHKIYYNSKNEQVPSVTTLLHFVNNHLDGWANYMGLSGVNTKNYVKEKADYGSYIHSLCEKFFKGVDLRNEVPDYRFVTQLFFDDLVFKLTTIKEMFERKGYEFYDCELSLTGEYYGGTIDLLLYNKTTDDFVILDFKTSKNTYIKQYVQLAGYSLLMREVKKAKVKAVCIILIEKQVQDSSFINLRLVENNIHNEQIFTYLSNIYYTCTSEERKFYYAS